MLAGEPNLVTLEGEPGAGKTILLAQFSQKHFDDTVSVFIKPTSWFTSDPDILSRDLVNQMNWIVSKQELPSRETAGNAALQKGVYELMRFSGRSGKKITFIIDGLTSIPAERQLSRDAILDLIPFGYPHFKFVFSGPSEVLTPLPQLNKLIHKTFQTPPFSREEARGLFNADVSPEFIQEIYTVCKGLPGYLGTVQRLLRSGIVPEQLLNDLPGSVPGLFDVEWKNVDHSNRLQVEVLAFLAYDKHPHSIGDLEVLFAISGESIRNALHSLSFISVPTSLSAPVEFVSESFRTYAAQKLVREKSTVIDKVVDALLQQPESAPALKLLPAYLSDTARHQSLLEYLSADRFERILATTEQLTPLQQTIELGLRTARKLNRDEDLFRFGVQSSTVAELNGFDVSRAEIEARMALGQLEASESLARGCVLKEDRLRLLAVIARKKKELKIEIEPEFLLQLEKIFNEVDWDYLAGYASQLAGDLIYSRPDLATQALEKAASRRKQNGPEPQLDWAIASLTLQTEGNASVDPVGFEHLRQQIKDPHVRQFTRAVSALVRNLSSEDIIQEVDKLSNPSEKLFLVRQWIVNSVKLDRIGDVVEFALTLGIQTTEYSPSASHLRELATGLRHVESRSQLESLLRMFDAQRSTVERLGPTLDYVRLQLLLARAEGPIDFSACSSRLIDTYLYVEAIPELGTRCSALAYFISELTDIDASKNLESNYQLHSRVQSDLKVGLPKLLDESADHEFVTRDIVKALAHTHTAVAVDIAMSLNIEPSRDSALSLIIQSMLEPRLRQIKFVEMPAIVAKFADDDDRDDALDDIIGRLATVNDAAPIAAVLDDALPILNLALRASDPTVRTRMSGGVVQILHKVKNDKYDSLRGLATAKMQSGLNAIDDVWERIDGAFDIATMLAPHAQELAAEYLKLAENLRGSVGLANSGKGFRIALRLAVRAYSGLVAKSVDVEQDLDELKSRIERIDSVEERVLVWSEIAMKMLRDSRDAGARNIVETEIWPMLRSVKEQDFDVWQACIHTSAPVLYRIHSKSALDEVANLKPQWRDSALRNISLFVFRHLPAWEPCEVLESDTFKVSWSECLDQCEIIGALENDAFIYEIIRSLSRSVKKGRTDLTSNQRTDLIQRLNKLIDTKLPSQRFIKHDGFKLISQARVMMLSKSHLDQWQRLAKEGTAIPNRADRVYVLATIAECCRGAEITYASTLIREGKKEADQITSLIDRVGRLGIIADSATEIDTSLSKACIREALELTKKQEDEEFDDMRRALIDLAYGISPELASTLIAGLDDDPVRKKSRALSRHVQLRELQKKLLEGASDGICGGLEAEDNVPEAAWMSLGALNGDKANPLHLSDLRPYLEFAAHLPLRRAYPILCWCIENASRRRQTGAKSQAHKTLRGIFAAALLGCDVSDRLSAQVSARFQQAASSSRTRNDRSESFLVCPGERKAALKYLGEWIEKNVVEYLKICDPFLGPEETIELLLMVHQHMPAISVYFLTSRKYQLDKKISQPFSESYERHWRQHSMQSPPETQVVVASLEGSHESPIHDRWMITKGAGLRLGTSFNGFGFEKDAEISSMDQSALESNESELQGCLSMRRRYKGKAVSYESFNL
jgi:hypothetical protein